jgi:hypothetical protein
MVNKGGEKGNPKDNGRPVCPVCGKKGHSAETCYLLRDMLADRKSSTSKGAGKRKVEEAATPKTKREKPKWKGDKGVQWENAHANIVLVSKPVEASSNSFTTASASKSAKSAKGKVLATAPEPPGPVLAGEMVFDSGATYAALEKSVDGVDNIRRSDWTMSFGNGNVAPIEQLGSIGALRDVALCTSMRVSVASISQLATEMECVTVFTGERAYVLKPGKLVKFKEEDVMITAKQRKGLYLASTAKFVDAIVQSSAELDSDVE